MTTYVTFANVFFRVGIKTHRLPFNQKHLQQVSEIYFNISILAEALAALQRQSAVTTFCENMAFKHFFQTKLLLSALVRLTGYWK